jgi:hypothetical protein
MTPDAEAGGSTIPDDGKRPNQGNRSIAAGREGTERLIEETDADAAPGEPEDGEDPDLDADVTEPIGRSEPFKQCGCTVLTILVLILLACSALYFVNGMFSMFLEFYDTFRKMS